MKRKAQRRKNKVSKAQIFIVIAIIVSCISGLAYGNADQTAKSTQTAPNVYSDKSTDVVDFSTPNQQAADPQPATGSSNSVQPMPVTGALPDDLMGNDNQLPGCRKGIDSTYCAQIYCPTAQCRMIDGSH
jgi:hypothetical protein